MEFGAILLLLSCSTIIVAALIGCARCRKGHTGQANFTSTPANENKRGRENAAVEP